MKKLLTILAITFVVISFSCKKPAGEGGDSSIRGMVWEVDYNASFSDTLGIYPAADKDIYIIYGDDITYGNKVKTGPEGIFEFPYLRKGNYKVYTYSKNRRAFLAGNPSPPDTAIVRGVEITEKKQTVDAGILEIYK